MIGPDGVPYKTGYQIVGRPVCRWVNNSAEHEHDGYDTRDILEAECRRSTDAIDGADRGNILCDLHDRIQVSIYRRRILRVLCSRSWDLLIKNGVSLHGWVEKQVSP